MISLTTARTKYKSCSRKPAILRLIRGRQSAETWISSADHDLADLVYRLGRLLNSRDREKPFQLDIIIEALSIIYKEDLRNSSLSPRYRSNPVSMASIAYPNHAKYFNTTRGINYCFAHFPPSEPDASTVVFLHGFPSSSADWHNQISHFRSLGFGALVIDSLGYGASSKPEDVSEYNFYKMGQDVAYLVSAVGLQTVHLVAHDFGCHVLARIVTFHAEIVKSATFIAVPFNMPGSPFDIDMVKEITTKLLGFEKFAYMRFLGADQSWKLLDQHAESMTSAMLSANYYKPDALKDWVTEDKKVPYPTWATSDWTSPSRRAALLGDGYRAPTNWYRALLSNQSLEEEKQNLTHQQAGSESKSKLKAPIMYIESAPSEASMPTPPLDQFFENVTVRQASTQGHWIMLESPVEVNGFLEAFIKDY